MRKMIETFVLLRKYMYPMVLLIFIIGCEKQQDVLVGNEEAITDDEISKNYYIIKFNNGGHHVIAVEKNDAHFLYSSDILVPKSEVKIIERYFGEQGYKVARVKIKKLNEKKSHSIEKSRAPSNACMPSYVNLWPDNTLYFNIDKKFPKEQKNLIFQGLLEWAKKTNLEMILVPKNHKDNKFVKITKADNGCEASVGYLPNGNMVMNLGPTCDKLSIIHEIGHSVGLIHEHQRPKRDQFLHLWSYNDKIKVAIATSASIAEFDKSLEITPVNNDSYNYDFNSVMHYGSWPTHDDELENYMKSNDIPYFRRLDNGALVPRPNPSLTADDIKKTTDAYFNGSHDEL